jgi:hypothetical protein
MLVARLLSLLLYTNSLAVSVEEAQNLSGDREKISTPIFSVCINVLEFIVVEEKECRSVLPRK